eukprot:m51a1_g4641 hypothetical protein (497) ;mRNA; r:344521-347667
MPPALQFVVKVHTADGSYKSFAADRSVDVREFTDMCLRKFNLPDGSPHALHEYREDPSGVSFVRLPLGVVIAEVVEAWPRESQAHRLVFSKPGASLSHDVYKKPARTTANPGEYNEAPAQERQQQPRAFRPPPGAVNPLLDQLRTRQMQLPKMHPPSAPAVQRPPPSVPVQQQQQQQQPPAYSAGVEAKEREVLEFINSHLKDRGLEVFDVLEDLKSGVLLIEFLEKYSGLRIQNWTREPADKAEEITNLNSALKFIRVLGCNVANCIAEDLYYGDKTTMLRLLVIVVQHLKRQTPQSREERRTSIVTVAASVAAISRPQPARPPGVTADEEPHAFRVNLRPTPQKQTSVATSQPATRAPVAAARLRDPERKMPASPKQIPHKNSGVPTPSPPRKAVCPENELDALLEKELGMKVPEIKRQAQQQSKAPEPPPVDVTNEDLLDLDKFIEKEFSGGMPAALEETSYDVDIVGGSIGNTVTKQEHTDLDDLLADLLNA